MFIFKVFLLMSVLGLTLGSPFFGLPALIAGPWRLCGDFPRPNAGTVYTNDRNSYYCPVASCISVHSEDCCGYFGHRLC